MNLQKIKGTTPEKPKRKTKISDDGKIIDKRIVNADTNVFRSSETEYRLYINVDYEVDGKQQTTTKYFCVPESTYLLYDIGDYFNSHSFEIE